MNENLIALREAQAIRILVANKLGANINEYGLKVPGDFAKIQKCLLRYFSEDARRAMKYINDNDLMERAREIVKGFNW